MQNYEYWGVSELIEKCENSETFAKEVASYLLDKDGDGYTPLDKKEVYLLEKARKLGNLK